MDKNRGWDRDFCHYWGSRATCHIVHPIGENQRKETIFGRTNKNNISFSISECKAPWALWKKAVALAANRSKSTHETCRSSLPGAKRFIIYKYRCCLVSLWLVLFAAWFHELYNDANSLVGLAANSKVKCPNTFCGLSWWAFLLKLLAGKCHRTLMILSRHWFR